MEGTWGKQKSRAKTVPAVPYSNTRIIRADTVFVLISAFFDNQPRRPRQRKKLMYQPVRAPAQNAWSVALGLLFMIEHNKLHLILVAIC